MYCMNFGRNVNRTYSSRRKGYGASKILEFLPGFWKCSQGFEVDPRVLELIPGFWS